MIKKKIFVILSFLMLIITLSSCTNATIDYYVDEAHLGQLVVSSAIQRYEIEHAKETEVLYEARCESPDKRFEIALQVGTDEKNVIDFKTKTQATAYLVVRVIDETAITGNTYLKATGFKTKKNSSAPKLSITNGYTETVTKSVFFSYSQYEATYRIKFKVEDSTSKYISYYQYRFCVNIAGIDYELKMY